MQKLRWGIKNGDFWQKKVIDWHYPTGEGGATVIDRSGAIGRKRGAGLRIVGQHQFIDTDPDVVIDSTHISTEKTHFALEEQ